MYFFFFLAAKEIIIILRYVLDAVLYFADLTWRGFLGISKFNILFVVLRVDVNLVSANCALEAGGKALRE